MISTEIIDTDAFLDMPGSSQLLYFHLNCRADDDGFIASPKKIVRMLGCQNDDLKILFSKKFVLPFEGGVCVIKHWRINNYIRKDIYKETKYTDLKNQLFIRSNGAYSLNSKNAVAVPSGHFSVENIDFFHVDVTCTERALSIGKVRLDNLSVKKKHMYNYEPIDESGNPIKKTRTKINKDTNTMLIEVGFLWKRTLINKLSLAESDIVMQNIYYPIRKCWEREKWGKDEFKKLFEYWCDDTSIKAEDKIAFDLCLSQKYVGRYKLSQKKSPKTYASVSTDIKL